MSTVAAWLYFALCELFALVVLFPLGLLIVGAACICRAWSSAAVQPSINPQPGRPDVDVWEWPINAVYGNPEDGVSGEDALGSWVGFYNPTGSRWRAFMWSALRNPANGFNYPTWRWAATPPLLVKTYSLPILGTRQLKLGWQRRYGRIVMACSA